MDALKCGKICRKRLDCRHKCQSVWKDRTSENKTVKLWWRSPAFAETCRESYSAVLEARSLVAGKIEARSKNVRSTSAKCFVKMKLAVNV